MSMQDCYQGLDLGSGVVNQSRNTSLKDDMIDHFQIKSLGIFSILTVDNTE